MHSRVSFVSIFLLLFGTSLSAVEIGARSLLVAPGVSQSALGGIGASTILDSFSVFYNPAHLSFLPNGVSINQKSWLGDAHFSQGAAVYSLNADNHFGIGVNVYYISFDEINDLGETTGTLGANSQEIKLAYSRTILSGLAAGTSVYFARESIDSGNNTAGIAGIDLGLQYQKKALILGKELLVDIGASYRGLGTWMNYGGETFYAPSGINIGMTTYLPWFGLFVPIEIGYEAESFSFQTALGGSYKINDKMDVQGYIGLPVWDYISTLSAGAKITFPVSTYTASALLAYQVLKIGNSFSFGLGLNY